MGQVHQRRKASESVAGVSRNATPHLRHKTRTQQPSLVRQQGWQFTELSSEQRRRNGGVPVVHPAISPVTGWHRDTRLGASFQFLRMINELPLLKPRPTPSLIYFLCWRQTDGVNWGHICVVMDIWQTLVPKSFKDKVHDFHYPLPTPFEMFYFDNTGSELEGRGQQGVVSGSRPQSNGTLFPWQNMPSEINFHTSTVVDKVVLRWVLKDKEFSKSICLSIRRK